jgi:hypothetical protein
MIATSQPDVASQEKRMPPSVFWALDPRLPRTAAQAAVEFDWLIQRKHGKDVNPSHASINALALLLGESMRKTQLGLNNKSFVDSMGLNLLAKAYNETYKATPVQTRDELAKAVKKLTSSLNAAQNEKKIEEEVLVGMREFCSALSEHAAVYRKMVYGSRQEQPYRR